MYRFAVLIGVCALLVGCALTGVQAQQISIAGDINSPEMNVDVSLRDADLSEVLSALFNTTGGKYQWQIGNGVVGRIPRLQLIHTPFDKALNAILGTEYSYTKQQMGDGRYLYRISGRNDTSAPAPGAAVPMMAPPTSSVPAPESTATATATTTTTPSTDSSDTSLAPVLSFTTRATTTPLGGGTTTAATTAAGAAAATETTVVKPIMINYLDIVSLCNALGGTVISLYVQSSASGGNNGNNNNGNNNNGYNNNGNNNNGYNNGNNNNNNYNTNRNYNTNNTNTNNNYNNNYNRNY